MTELGQLKKKPQVDNTITFDELVEAARPLIKLLREKRDPMTTAIVKGWEVVLVQAEMGCPVNSSLKPGEATELELKRQLEERRFQAKQEIVECLNKMTTDFNRQLAERERQGKLCDEKGSYFRLMGFLLTCCWRMVNQI